jgi:hypothetical protein
LVGADVHLCRSERDRRHGLQHGNMGVAHAGLRHRQ